MPALPTNPDQSSIGNLAEIKAIVAQNGLFVSGACPAADYPSQDQLYAEWLGAGNHGTMEFMKRHAPLKYHPGEILPDCKSLIFIGLNYYQERPEPSSRQGLVATYAWGRDYHKVLGKKLLACRRELEARFPSHQFMSFTDTCPIDERFYAEKAGISYTGRNHLSISPEYGSWFLLGEILCTLDLSPDLTSPPRRVAACPSGCKRCIDACPTGALGADGSISIQKCVAYLTIEHKGPIPIELRRAIGNRIYGCDDCQTSCPHNLRAQPTNEADFRQWKAGPVLDISHILNLSEMEFKQEFAGSPLMRAGHASMQRNALIVAGNSGDPALIKDIERHIDSADPVLAEHARWAMEQLGQA